VYPSEISRRAATAFNEAINRHDLGALEALMSEDHAFVDTAGKAVAGRDEVLAAWRGFFVAFPDYRNEWTQVTSIGRTVAARGRSVCTSEPALDGPAIWTATTSGDKVSEWRVFDDTPENRDRLGIAAEPPGA
jgi:ketosteroid isomerase-like protein